MIIDRARLRSERGTGLIGTTAGIAVFLVFLLFAVQLTVDLYARSSVSAAGYDAARSVAARNVDHDDPASVRRAVAHAEQGFRDLLGDLGRDAEVTWQVDAEQVRLRVRADSPTIVPRALEADTGLGRIDRTFVVRIEEAV